MVDVTLWTGPIGNAQVPACFVPGSLFPPVFNCQNPEPPPILQPPGGHIYNCQTRAEQVRSGNRYLPGMLRAVGVNPANVQNVYLASFSAGHNVVKDRVFMSPEDRAMVKTFYSCDSTYTGWIGDDPRKGPFPKPGYVSFMLDCLQQQKLFLATAGKSTPMGSDGKPLPSSGQTMWGLAAEIERITGKTFKAFDPGFGPTPSLCKRLDGENGGAIVLCDFPTVQHQDQPRIIAPLVWREVLMKWLNVECGDPATTVASLTGLGATAKSCKLYIPKPMDTWMADGTKDPGFMDKSGGQTPNTPKPGATGWGVGDVALFGASAAAGWFAYNRFIEPALRERVLPRLGRRR